LVARERIHPNKYRCAGEVNTQTSPNGIQLAQKHLNINGEILLQDFNNKKIHNMKYVIRQCFDYVKYIKFRKLQHNFNALYLSIARVRSVKTQLIYCQLNWRHVSTQGVIIRLIIEPCLRYIKWKCTFGIPKCLQQCENVSTVEVGIYNIIYIKMYPCSLKSAQTGNAVKTFCHCCKHFGIPKMCTFIWCTSNMVQ